LKHALGTKKWRVPLPDGTTLLVRTPNGWTKERARAAGLRAYKEGKVPEPGPRPEPEPEPRPEVLDRIEAKASAAEDVVKASPPGGGGDLILGAFVAPLSE
jgi:hypothetical protein